MLLEVLLCFIFNPGMENVEIGSEKALMVFDNQLNDFSQTSLLICGPASFQC